jgi:hypothetical protein
MSFLEWILNKLGKGGLTEEDLEERPVLQIEPPKPVAPPQKQEKEEKRVVIIDL